MSSGALLGLGAAAAAATIAAVALGGSRTPERTTPPPQRTPGPPRPSEPLEGEPMEPPRPGEPPPKPGDVKRLGASTAVDSRTPQDLYPPLRPLAGQRVEVRVVVRLLQPLLGSEATELLPELAPVEVECWFTGRARDLVTFRPTIPPPLKRPRVEAEVDVLAQASASAWLIAPMFARYEVPDHEHHVLYFPPQRWGVRIVCRLDAAGNIVVEVTASPARFKVRKWKALAADYWSRPAVQVRFEATATAWAR